MLARVLAVIVSVRLCVCVTRRYCIKTAKRRITQTTPCDSPGTLVSDANSRWWETQLPHEICAQSDPPFFENQDFDQYQLILPN